MVAVWQYPGDEIDHLVRLPGPYMRSAAGTRELASVFPYVSVLAWSDTMVTGISAHSGLFLSDWQGRVFDTLAVPVARRRGVPPQFREFVESPGTGFKDIMEATSTLELLARSRDGRVMVVHHDPLVDGEPPTLNITNLIYTSVISAGLGEACVDGLVPLVTELRPVQTVVEDTLFVLDRSLSKDGAGVETWVRLYTIDTAQCDWVEMK